MPGRGRLTGGKPRLLGHHGGWQGKAYGRAWAALEQAHTLDGPLKQLEAGRVAVRFVAWQRAVKALREAERARANGRGRRPSAGLLRQLVKREALEDAAYARALGRLALVAPPKSPLNGAGWR